MQRLRLHLQQGMCHVYILKHTESNHKSFAYTNFNLMQDECAGMYFEEQGAGFRCPQCSGPRRRYAKKVGDVVGTTLDGGDAPILIFSFGGVIATIAFGIWAVENL